ncbi:hypothetical protein [Caryophanon latum]|uniref:Uncharacterized protein n=1 Tax=Caryophanon latum TaxID=33977 RepID=A0A1C0Z5M3_9BACL|nr:hypothetical protein [Caryophanon latum]OCS94672.1 hypothetical protein A6K76_00440 [Caryophanon latum]
MRTFFTTAALATALLASCNTTKPESITTANDTTETTAIETEEQTMPTFIAQQGTITSLNQTDDGLFVEATLNDEPLTFLLFDDTPIVNNKGEDVTLQEGMNVQGYVYANSPMVMIYPPRYTPAIIVVETGDVGMYSVASFNDDHVNDTNMLQVTTDEPMPAGNYAVFYTTSTRSIPAQATPHRIIALPNRFAEATE